MGQEDRSTHKYDDIIHLPHPEPQNHPRMSMHDRAAQFSPFAPSTKHADAFRKPGGRTDGKEEVGGDENGFLSGDGTGTSDEGQPFW